MLADLMENPSSQEILRRAKEDRTSDPEDITPWIVTEHPDWLEVRKTNIESTLPAQSQELRIVGDGSNPAVQEPLAVVERFKAQHHGIEINFKDYPRTIEVLLYSGFIWQYFGNLMA